MFCSLKQAWYVIDRRVGVSNWLLFDAILIVSFWHLQPYDMVFEMEEINEDWDDVDVTLVIGGTIT